MINFLLNSEGCMSNNEVIIDRRERQINKQKIAHDTTLLNVAFVTSIFDGYIGEG